MFPLQDLSGFLMVYIRCLLKRLGLVFSSVYHETDHASSEAHMTHVTCFSRLPFLCQTDSAAKRPELFQNPGTGSVRFSLAAVGFRLSPVQLWEGIFCWWESAMIRMRLRERGSTDAGSSESSAPESWQYNRWRHISAAGSGISTKSTKYRISG